MFLKWFYFFLIFSYRYVNLKIDWQGGDAMQEDVLVNEFALYFADAAQNREPETYQFRITVVKMNKYIAIRDRPEMDDFPILSDSMQVFSVTGEVHSDGRGFKELHERVSQEAAKRKIRNIANLYST